MVTPYQPSFARHGKGTSLVPVMMNDEMNGLLIVWYCSDRAILSFVRRAVDVSAETQLFSGWYRNAIVFWFAVKRNSFRFLPWRTLISAKSPRYAKTSLRFVFRGTNKVRGAHTLVICLFTARLVFVRTCARLKSDLIKFLRLKSEEKYTTVRT